MGKDYTNSVDVIQHHQLKQTYYDRNLNNDLGNKRQKNITLRKLNNGNVILWEIKTDAQTLASGYFFLETHQIKCGCKPVFEKSGVYTTDWTHFMVGIPDPDDVEMNGRYLLTCTWTRDELFSIMRKYIEENNEEGRNRNIGFTEDVHKDFPDAYWMTYVIENCKDGTKRYSRGLRIPVHILFDRFYLTNMSAEVFKLKAIENGYNGRA